MCSPCLFVCLFVDYDKKTIELIFTLFAGKVAHWSRKNQLHFLFDNPHHVTLGLELA